MGEINKTDRLSLTPREGEARAQLSPSGRVSKEVGDRAPADVAEEAHRPPNAQPFDAAAVAEREVRLITIKNVIGYKPYTVVIRGDRPDVQYKHICCVVVVVVVVVVYRFKVSREPTSASHNVGPDGGCTKVTPLCEVVGVLNFPQICPDTGLREAQSASQSRAGIRLVGLEMIGPIPVSAQFEVLGDIPAASHA
jgi:hypothetical protein